MATSTDLSRALREVVHAIVGFSSGKKWGDLDYWIYYYINEEWGRLNMIFVATGFDGQDSSESYREVLGYIRDHVEETIVQELLNLVVRSKAEVDQGGIYGIGPKYKEYFTLYRDRNS